MAHLSVSVSIDNSTIPLAQDYNSLIISKFVVPPINPYPIANLVSA